jgi:hypothetical protein
VVDLDKASRNASRLVEFSSDLCVLRLKDPTRGNGAMLVEMSNRGSRSALRLFNHGGPNTDPESSSDLGDGFLMKYGFASTVRVRSSSFSMDRNSRTYLSWRIAKSVSISWNSRC